MESFLISLPLLCLLHISTPYHIDYDHDREILDPEEMDYSHFEHRRYQPRYYRRRPYGSSGGKFPTTYDDDYDYDECDNCQCNQCDNPPPCCQPMCVSCNQQPINTFLVPFPVPMLVNFTTTVRTTCYTVHDTTEPPTTETPEPPRTKPTTTPVPTTTVETPTILRNVNNKYMLTSVRRTKPNALAKYGIMPIPDQLAESLMSLMRTMKNINARKN